MQTFRFQQALWVLDRYWLSNLSNYEKVPYSGNSRPEVFFSRRFPKRELVNVAIWIFSNGCDD